MADLVPTKGMTLSEDFLARLCRRAFLSLWSYPNLFKDQGKKGPTGDGKEICDLLVVFGDDVLIFSDKHCAFRADKPVEVAWRRWYSSAILESAGQIFGAERWLTQFPGRVFTDRGCTKPLPIAFPARPTFHRILTCRGSAEISRRVWGGTGSLFVTNAPLEECATTPFRLGAFDEKGRMYHAFEEVALEAVLTSLDTISDLCEYLRKREAFFRRGAEIVAAGEDALVGFYLWNLREDGGGHDFVVQDGPTHISIDEDFWSTWMKSRQRKAKLEADRVSYAWDNLAEKFVHHMVSGTLEVKLPSSGGTFEHERSVRWMAREPRIRRRILAGSLLEVMQNTGPTQIRRRLMPPTRPDEPFWVFLVLPRRSSMTYADYRDFRGRFLAAHCFVVKYLHPAALDIVALAVEPPGEGMSEDIIYFDAREWTPEMEAEAKRLHEEAHIFESGSESRKPVWEFPIDVVEAPLPKSSERSRRAGDEQKKKRTRQAQKKARRRNRR